MPARALMSLNDVREKAAGFDAGTLTNAEYTVVAVSPLYDTPNSSVAEFQATPGSRPNPADSVTCAPTAAPLRSTMRPWMATVGGKLFQTTKNFWLVSE